MRKLVTIYVLICCSALPAFGQNSTPVPGIALVPENRDLFIRIQHGVYGIGDSSHYWLSNAPTGDTIFHIKDRLFAVRGTDRLYTIYDDQLKARYAQVSGIKESGRYVFLKDSKGWKILSPDDDELQASVYDSIRIAASYALLYKHGKQGLLKTQGPIENMVPAEYDKAGLYYDGVLLIDHGKLGWQGTFSVPVNYDHIYKERPDILAAQNASGTIYYSCESGRPLLAEPTDSIVFYDRYYKRVRGKMQSIFRIRDNSLVAEIEGEELHPFSFSDSYGESGYCVIGRGSACALYRNGKVLTDFSYRNILAESSIKPPFFRVVQDGGVGVILENGEAQLAADYTDVLSHVGNFYIVRRGSRLGLVTKGDTVLLPCEYRNITFCDDTYLYLSKDGTYFGLYNYVKRKEISPYKYREFLIDTAFIVAKQVATSDVYYKDEAVLPDVYDAESNRSTVKGYKNGKIYVGSVRKGAWESYEYEIPSYKVKAAKEYRDFLESSWLQDIADTYDYASGKWGRFSYMTGKWGNAPLAHGGNPSGSRLLDFPVDSSLTWQGIGFHVRKKVAPMQIAWNRKSKFSWIDTQTYGYSNDDKDRSSLTVSPICYTEPGAGKCLNHFNPVIINTGFSSVTDKSVLAESGRVKVANYGQISLSAFITQMSASGNVHPASLKDYETLIDPGMFVSISGSTEHILHRSARAKHISVHHSFEWVDTEHLNPVIFRAAGKYGLLSDTGSYLLKPEYESLTTIGGSKSSTYLAGVRSSSYRIYYPESNTYSKEIAELLSFKGPYLLVRADSMRLAVIDHQLDTLLVSAGSISLLEDSGYVLKKDGISTIYKNRNILFSHTGDITEKINAGHYLISNSAGNYIMSPKGDTIYQSRRPIRYVPLGNNYLLDSGEGRTVFDLSDKAVCRFEKEPYLVTAHQDLIVKEKESTTLLKKNGKKPVHIHGRFTRATKLYVVSKTTKTKNVYDYSGKPLVTNAAKVKVLNDRYFSYQQGKKFMLYDMLTGEKKRIERLGVSITKEGLEYDGSDDEEDSTEVVETIEEIYSVVAYKGKYGLKKEEKLLLPYAFFHIQKASDVFLVQDKIEYKLYDLFSNQFISTDTYEKVHPYKNHFQVFREGKMYYISK